MLTLMLLYFAFGFLFAGIGHRINPIPSWQIAVLAVALWPDWVSRVVYRLWTGKE